MMLRLLLLAASVPSNTGMEEPDTVTIEPPTIEISEVHGGLRFSSPDLLAVDQLPKEYAIGTTLKISTSPDLARLVVLSNKEDLGHRVPLRLSNDSKRAPNAIKDDYELELSNLGDFCFALLDWTSASFHASFYKTASSFNRALLEDRNNYCFRVLPRDLLLMTRHTIVVEEPVRLSHIKEEIRKQFDAFQATAPGGCNETNNSGRYPHKPTILGISVAYETHAILIGQLHWEKVLFLVQHLVHGLTPYMGQNDAIITIPPSRKLKAFDRATSSERVAVVMSNARHRYPWLRGDFEMQYSTHESSTFGGRILLDVSDSTKSGVFDVPSRELAMADLHVAIGPIHKHNKLEMGVSVITLVQKDGERSRKADPICFEEANLESAGYDLLHSLSEELVACIVTSMGVDTDVDEAKDAEEKDQEPAKFELALQGGKCCFLQLADSSSHHAMFRKEDLINKQQEVVMLSAEQLTIGVSEALTASEKHNITDLVFYLDLVDDVNHFTHQDLSIHSKIHTFHHLLYSGREVVFAPNGLWFVCASWTEKTPSSTSSSSTSSSSTSSSSTSSSSTPWTDAEKTPPLSKHERDSVDGCGENPCDDELPVNVVVNDTVHTNASSKIPSENSGPVDANASSEIPGFINGTHAADAANETRKSTCSQNLYFNTCFMKDAVQDMNDLQQEPPNVLKELDESGMLELQHLHLQSLVHRILGFRSELNDQYHEEIDLYDNIVSHKLSAESYLTQIKKLKQRLDDEISQKEKKHVDISDLKEKLKKLGLFLEEEAALAAAHGDKLTAFREIEIDDQMRQLEMMRIAIVDADSQTQRLRFGIDTSHDVMKSLHREFEAVRSLKDSRSYSQGSRVGSIKGFNTLIEPDTP